VKDTDSSICSPLFSTVLTWNVVCPPMFPSLKLSMTMSIWTPAYMDARMRTFSTSVAIISCPTEVVEHPVKSKPTGVTACNSKMSASDTGLKEMESLAPVDPAARLGPASMMRRSASCGTMSQLRMALVDINSAPE